MSQPIYYLLSPWWLWKDAAARFSSVDSRDGPAPQCSVCGQYLSGFTWLPPYVVDLSLSGVHAGDLAFGVSLPLLASERAVRIWTEYKITGFSVLGPVEIRNLEGPARKRLAKVVSRYLCVDVARTQAQIDLRASEVEDENGPVSESCKACGSWGWGIFGRWKRIVLVPDTIPDLDLFIPRGLNDIIASEQFKRVCEEQQVRNATFLPLTDYHYDFSKARGGRTD